MSDVCPHCGEPLDELLTCAPPKCAKCKRSVVQCPRCRAWWPAGVHPAPALVAHDWRWRCPDCERASAEGAK